MKVFVSLLVIAAMTICGADCASAITIQIDYSYDANNFFNTQQKKDLLQDAADTLASRLTDQLTAIVPSGGNTWTVNFFNPATGVKVFLQNPTVPANTIVVYAGGRDLGSSGNLGVGGNGSSVDSGDPTFLAAVASRGQGVVTGPSATDYATWGGNVTFNTNAAYSFSNQVPTDATYDFFTVAIHELGHVLGFGTADSWLNDAGGAAFSGSHATAANGGVSPLLSSDKSHWLGATMSDGRYAAMDSSLYYNTRTGFTSLDFAGLADIGWTLAPLGIPGDVNHDGIVNIQDITAVANHWQTPNPLGDANHDSIDDIQDITLIANHWLQISGGGANVMVVPEPATIVGLATGALLLAVIGRRRIATASR